MANETYRNNLDMYNLPYSMSKQEEQITLARLAESVQMREALYLADLFSPELVEWFKGQIVSDLDCNPVRQIKDRDIVISRLRQDYDNAIARARSAEATVSEERIKHMEAGEAHKAAIAAYEEHATLILEVSNNRLAELETVKAEAAKTEATKDLEILKLKARLWDLEHPEG